MRNLSTAALLAAAASPALAVALPAGVATPLPGTTVAARPELAGVVLVDRIVPFTLQSGTGSFSGTVQQRVSRSDADGTLIFSWRVFNDANSDAGIDLVRIGGFGAYVADGDWRIDGVGQAAPASAYNFGTGAVNFGFDRPDGVAPGLDSNFFFLKTTATRYVDSGFMDLTGYRVTAGAGPSFVYSAGFSTFAPQAAVPEPATWGLMIAGFGVVGMVARRRVGSVAG